MSAWADLIVNELVDVIGQVLGEPSRFAEGGDEAGDSGGDVS
ncbi:hypothetical protein [Mycolicibacter arupensis]|jgi:hypothetical protein|nr:hypothetical protein [Mycolicibacter arupensis]